MRCGSYIYMPLSCLGFLISNPQKVWQLFQGPTKDNGAAAAVVIFQSSLRVDFFCRRAA